MDDLFERIAAAHEVFVIEFPKNPEVFMSFSKLVDWLELALIGWGPNGKASQLLKRIAERDGNPRLAQGLDSEWRREQIAAVLRELFGENFRA